MTSNHWHNYGYLSGLDSQVACHDVTNWTGTFAWHVPIVYVKKWGSEHHRCRSLCFMPHLSQGFFLHPNRQKNIPTYGLGWAVVVPQNRAIYGQARTGPASLGSLCGRYLLRTAVICATWDVNAALENQVQISNSEHRAQQLLPVSFTPILF